ncbi:MBOAT family O-acyltransferase [Slackia heliotrinireducens]|uniref:Predicted membrane protein involved in D-alanine export n=1 Tax=Slackia heliotrinireducens (strain ATCC 29202 / DSM 20476 / NCTC 11029 / RHS 1) TaxID=471855 RepID=C7N756_SLAHD|nr:MBOAT family O-acyltransferase [Slackia heliotrinireducens]ACV22741.1 predicted membrane protein involved in D-alanine export [Slackia heliotrinireducens DSM 20476]VEH01388.1 D-alanyl-lipoteichoic acid biosynthesis protein DltB [Slackia heliotrinireducens]
MQLYSIQFVAFLCVALVAYYALGRAKPSYQWTVLLAASMVFYYATGWQNFFFILLTAASTWGVGLAFGAIEKRSKEARASIKDRKEKKAVKAKYNRYKWYVLLAALILNFGVLAYIKYWNALLTAVGFGDSFLASSLLLPLGLSFYTFQSASYVIDTYNAKYEPERNFAKYLLFVSFFPQLIQGPINRFDALAHQLFESHGFDAERSRRALVLIGYGMLKKYVVADLLVTTIAACLDNVTGDTPGSIILFGILLYSAQQYGDFSGGIDMVRGVAMLFGIDMAQNFRQPYFSISLGDFWRRWHITLGAWMRDYVFYPFALTGAMQNLGKWCGAHLGRHWGRTVPASIANILVFFLVGLWHGADAHFIWWGLYNGIVIAAADLATPLWEFLIAKFHVNVESAGWHLWRILRTFIVVNIGWYFDRILVFGDVLTGFYNTLFNFAPSEFWPVFQTFHIHHVKLCLVASAIGCIIVFIVSVLRERGVDVTGELLKKPVVVRYAIYAFCMLMVICSFVIAPAGGGFIYANF